MADRGSASSPPPRVISIDADEIAERIVQKLIEKAADEAAVEKIVEVWGKVLDQHLGRGLRRLLWLVITGLCVYIGIKFDLLTKTFFG